jgi:A118 family predicted phage portal protein
VSNTAAGFEMRRRDLKLPKYVRNVKGDGQEMFYQEINPTLNTETRIAGINALLNQIGYKCGFSNGHFVFNEKTGIQTATQVEADQQRTIQFIKDVRDRLQNCITDLCFALSAFADLYALAPAGAYELTFDFGDITYSYEEDKANWRSYASMGWVPKWLYLVKFEGLTEEEAKALVKEAEPKTPALFGGE